MARKKKPSRGQAPRTNRSRPLALAAAGVIALAIVAWLLWPRSSPESGTRAIARDSGPRTTMLDEYAGSASCRDCHADAFALWRQSHHHLAERPPHPALDQEAFDPPRTLRHGSQATSVRFDDDFLIDLHGGQDSEPLRVERVIGHSPLRQYLVPADGGRLQAVEAAYDPLAREWFTVFGDEDRQPGEWGHWSGRGMNWNSMCGTCHNTGFQKNYQPEGDTYATAMAELGVGCESCHGPMRKHVEWQRREQGRGPDPTLAQFTPAVHMENCAPCHARRGEVTGDFAPGDSFWDHFLLSIVDHQHLFHPDGQILEEDYEFAPFLGSRMHAAGVTCTDCHDPHSGRTRLQGNQLCLQCHDGSRPGSPIIDPARHTFHAPESAGSLCVNCHMPQTVYMQRHPRHDHGFTTPDPLLTLRAGVPNACNRCHTDRDAQWALDACEQWYGPRMERHARRRALAIAAARQGSEAAVPDLLKLIQPAETPYWRASLAAMLEPWASRPEVAETLQRALADGHPLVRTRAAQALAPLAEAGEQAVTDRMTSLLEDPVRSVRIAAAWALRARLNLDSPAGRDLRRMLEINSDQPAGQAQLAAFEWSRGRIDAALDHYERALRWDPGSSGIRLDYAVALSAAGRVMDALAQAREAARTDPDSAEAHYRLGLAWNEAGQPQQAIDSLTEAARLDPRHDRALYNLGLALHAAGRTEDAMDSLLRAEQANPRDPRIPYARATILAQQGRPRDALIAVERVLELEPGYGPALELRRILSP